MRVIFIAISFITLLFTSCTINNTEVKSSSESMKAVSNYNLNCKSVPCCNCQNEIDAKICKPCKSYIYAIGKGAPPNDESLSEVQRYLLAERAAIVDGYRQLAEKLQGFIVTTLTRSGNYIIDMDLVKVQAEAMIRGAEVVEIEHSDNGVCKAKIRIRLPQEERIIAGYTK